MPAESLRRRSLARSSLESEPLTVPSSNYLFKIHAMWTVSIFRAVKILRLMRISFTQTVNGNRTNKE